MIEENVIKIKLAKDIVLERMANPPTIDSANTNGNPPYITKAIMIGIPIAEIANLDFTIFP